MHAFDRFFGGERDEHAFDDLLKPLVALMIGPQGDTLRVDHTEPNFEGPFLGPFANEEHIVRYGFEQRLEFGARGELEWRSRAKHALDGVAQPRQHCIHVFDWKWK